jgi:hypothetical protein
MTTTTMKARRVRIRIEEGKTGLFYATSPDLKGLLVAEPTMDALHRAIPECIRALYAACDVDVVVTEMDDGDEEYSPWIAIPSALAKAALGQSESF